VATGAVTFDFHDTLATCDAWFDLEVRRLASAFLTWLYSKQRRAVPAALAGAADDEYRRLRRAIHVHGHELSAERCLATVLERLGLDVRGAEIAEGVDAMMRGALADTRPIPGAVEAVRALANDGVPLGIVSSAVHHPFLEWSLDRFGIRDAFAVVTTSASAGYYKSRPEIFWQTLRVLAATPARSVHVGDSPRLDVESAHRIGMQTVWVRGRREASESPRLTPDVILRDLSGASSVVARLLDQAPAERHDGAVSAVPTAGPR
jgi:HAD superfamily hydrolase (TIGR01509 family)